MPVFGCESGEACQAQFSAESSLSQGEDFARMTRAFHGGRKTRRSHRRMHGGAADYATGFDTLPADLQSTAEVGALNKAFSDLTQFLPKAQAGGKRRGRKSRKSRKSRKLGRKLRGGMAPIEAPSMLLRPEDEPAAFLNPQWYNENIVNPNFHAPSSPYMEATKGGARKSRKSRKSRKASKKSRKSRKGRKASKKSRKTRKGRKMTGGKRRRSSSKRSRKGRKAAKKSRKH